MRCRRIKTWVDEQNQEHKDIVWFGSYGKNADGSSKMYSSNNVDNFSSKETAIKDSLSQKLSVLKNELWYNLTYGLPLFEKQKSKIAIDSAVLSIILENKEIISIEDFQSQLIDRLYSAKIIIKSIYGNIQLSI